MLTDQDIKKLIKVFVTKEDLEDLASKEDVRALQTSIDGLAKMVKDFRDEHIIMHRRIQTLESWAKKVSEKVRIPLPV